MHVCWVCNKVHVISGSDEAAKMYGCLLVEVKCTHEKEWRCLWNVGRR